MHEGLYNIIQILIVSRLHYNCYDLWLDLFQDFPFCYFLRMSPSLPTSTAPWPWPGLVSSQTSPAKERDLFGPMSCSPSKPHPRDLIGRMWERFWPMTTTLRGLWWSARGWGWMEAWDTNSEWTSFYRIIRNQWPRGDQVQRRSTGSGFSAQVNTTNKCLCLSAVNLRVFACHFLHPHRLKDIHKNELRWFWHSKWSNFSARRWYRKTYCLTVETVCTRSIRMRFTHLMTSAIPLRSIVGHQREARAPDWALGII